MFFVSSLRAACGEAIYPYFFWIASGFALAMTVMYFTHSLKSSPDSSSPPANFAKKRQ